MFLIFIGKDGSMGLRHGRRYRVFICNDYKYIWVKWHDQYGELMKCPYSSPLSLAANWEGIEQ